MYDLPNRKITKDPLYACIILPGIPRSQVKIYDYVQTLNIYLTPI